MTVLRDPSRTSALLLSTSNVLATDLLGPIFSSCPLIWLPTQSLLCWPPLLEKTVLLGGVPPRYLKPGYLPQYLLGPKEHRTSLCHRMVGKELAQPLPHPPLPGLHRHLQPTSHWTVGFSLSFPPVHRVPEKVLSNPPSLMLTSYAVRKGGRSL